MKISTIRAFTLIELLVVIAIVAILASVILPVYGSVQLSGKKTQSLSNMRQLGTALVAYCGDNNGILPGTSSDKNPTWASAATNTDAENSMWFNVLPRNYANQKGVGDYASKPADFYAKGNLLYVPAAKYPSTKLTGPLFAVAINSKLQTSTNAVPRLQEIPKPSETVVFQESGLPGETTIKGQSTYSSQSCSYASRTVARYNGKTILVFADGHADFFDGTSVVDPGTGKAYFPPIAGASIFWSMDPTVTPN